MINQNKFLNENIGLVIINDSEDVKIDLINDDENNMKNLSDMASAKIQENNQQNYENYLDIKFNKIENEKINILKEILASEKKYLQDLKEIVEGYYEELLNSNNDVLELVSIAFSNVKDILEFTQKFYQDLELCSNNAIGIANCFINNGNEFYEQYLKYCQNYQNAFGASEKLEKKSEINRLIQKIKHKYGHNLKLASYLQVPVLHITKYHLLLSRYLKLINKNDNEKLYLLMLEALNIMKKVAVDLNKGVNEFSPPISKLVNTNDMTKLIEKYGDILKQGDLYLIEQKKDHYVILFKNMFIIRKPMSNDLFHSIASDSLSFLPKSFKYKNSDRCFTVIDYSEGKNHNMSQFTFKTRTVEEKLSWQTVLIGSMINTFSKKIPENEKAKVMQFDTKYDNKNDYVKTRIKNRKSTNDSKFNWKFDIRKAINKKIKNKSYKRIKSIPNINIENGVDETHTISTTNSFNSTRVLNDGSIVDYLPENNEIFSDTVSSTSSINSEEGYYSNHESISSSSTLIDENQLNNEPFESTLIFNDSKRTISYPEISQQTNFKIIKMKEQNKQIPKAEIIESIISPNFESPQLNVKYLSNIFGRSKIDDDNEYSFNNNNDNNNDNYSYQQESGICTTFNETLITNYFTPQRRSMSAYKINTSNTLDKDKLLKLKLNSIKRTGINTFKVERVSRNEEKFENNNVDNDEFLLRDVFGMRFLMEAEYFFGRGIRDLIMKFENKVKNK